ncbi:TMV resistance protein N-like [Pyrus x bretschneideri]|uniref:TMV resistance protein N-like n=1 Tax=Pyrus x bretschneideri TaxID=225117 RepID=UPI00202FC557|nr:TMV resistance protein N-like [Pyrus x bretschneideri]
MERLAGDRLPYSTRSRIVIISRVRGILRHTIEEDNIYKVEVLKLDDALQLFCSRAFKNNSTRRTNYKELAKKAVHYARGVPLEYDRLGKNEKEIFLDVACFHKGWPMEYVKQRLNVCGLFGTTRIRILIDMSLVSIDSKWGRKTIEMHDLPQEMGRTIVQKECTKDLGKPDRLFIDKDVYRVLKSNMC